MITHHSPRSVHAARARRRGVLLLVVLILLVLFVMMAVTYVLVATRQLSTSKAYARKDSTGDPPPQQLDGVAMQLLRGSTNQHSVLYPHSLLEHMYGPYGFTGIVNAVDPAPTTPSNATRNPSTSTDPNTDQVVEFTATNPQPVDSSFYSAAQLNDLKTISLTTDGYLDGCVITMTSGQAKGLSSRIVRYDASTPSNPIFHVLAFKGASGSIAPQLNDTFLINGRAFSGTGRGNDSVTTTPPIPADEIGVLDAKDGNAHEFALLPNPLFYQPTGKYAVSVDFPKGIPFGGLGGSNMDYDAPDYQHMAMSWTVMNSATGQAQTVLPSFHRPDLINYWANRAKITDWKSNPDLLRQIMLRPNLIDHPNFTGSNPNLSGANFYTNISWQPSLGTPCPWDVDNDGDGVADSVWIDAGYPVQAAADGKLYKPLFAILCVDLDGRLNVNAAGTTEQLSATHSQQITGPFAGTNGLTAVTLPRGEGLGTAEIDLFDPANPTAQSPLTQAQAAQLLQGGTVNSVKYDGRYGDSTTSNPAGPQAGVPGSPTLLGLIMRFQYPSNNFDPTTNNIFPLSSFDSPSDLWGRMAVGLDFRGEPLFWKPALAGSTGWVGELRNNPYDMNLSIGGSYQAYGSQSADNPFGVYDLERLLRQFDVDTAELPRRLFDLSGAGPVIANPSAFGFTSAQAQAMIQAMGHTMTTDSWDPPSPGVVAPDYLRDQLSTVYGRKFATNIVELLTARLLKENPSWLLLPQATMQAQINANIRQLLSPEVIVGLRMNINRPLGDGRDGNGNNVVDEVPPPGKYSSPPSYGAPWDNNTAELSTEGNNTLWTWLSNSLKGFTWNTTQSISLDLVNGTDVNGDGVVDINDQIMARQLLSRHLYVLARLMIDDDVLSRVQWFAKDSNLNTVQIKELAIRRIAQWAVNVVDFMDPDNTMTPFEYDENPFTNDDPAGHPGKTWEVNGILDDASSLNPDDTSAWRRLVWGCERPELLLNETLAFHDRRVKDSKFDLGLGKTTQDMPNPDPTFDQVRIPQGSAFFELYCTGNPNQPQQSGDLYQYDNTNKVWMLNLSKMAPPDAATNTSYPVWRLAITGPDSNQKTATNDVQTQVDPTQPNSHPASYSFDTANASASLLAGASITPPLIERVVWFTNVPPTAGATYDGIPANQIYYRHDATATNSPLLLGCGQYAVVGPRQVTRIGWTTNPDPTPGSMYAAPGYQPSCAKIELTPGLNGVSFSDQTIDAGGNSAPATNYPNTANMIQPPLAIIAATDVTTAMTAMGGWSSTNSPAAVLDTKDATAQIPHGIGISVSEPLAGATYYKEPTVKRDAFDGEPGVTDCYARVDETDPMGTGLKFLDQPQDSDPAANRPLYANNSLATGTYLNYKTVLLQRLANPLIPYDPITNPYLTVDWMPIDLTVFNGQATLAQTGSPSDPDDAGHPNLKIRFASRQRNGKLNGTEPSCLSDFDLWFRGMQLTRAGDQNQITSTNCTLDDPPETAKNDATTKMVFPHELKYYRDPTNPSTSDLAAADPNGANSPSDATKKGLHSFGFVDSYFQQPFGQSFGQATLTYGPLALSEVTATYIQHVGDPRSPFPWLTWNNRPYASIAELMMVPASHPGRLLYEFGLEDTGANPYLSGASSNDQLAPFSHLLNFFNSATDPTTATNLSQMFEYVQVPSPFVGTQEVLNPQTFQGGWWQTTAGKPGESPTGTEPAGTAGLHPPFNMVSNYRDPGKVNINTITDGSVWNAIVGGSNYSSGMLGPNFNKVVISRRGYPSVAPYGFDTTGKFPSLFSNPFRSAAGADMVPIPGKVTAGGLSHNPTNVTLFRAGGFDPDGGSQRLMATELTPGYTSQPYSDETRSAYFNYQALGHLTSKLTTRSNVYAVWITVGYFEVTPWYGVSATGAPNTAGPQVFDTAHPDGYQLGEELGSDTGQVERHRAFYIIDRSIPVGFQRGYDNNANKAVLLKRFIE